MISFSVRCFLHLIFPLIILQSKAEAEYSHVFSGSNGPIAESFFDFNADGSMDVWQFATTHKEQIAIRRISNMGSRLELTIKATIGSKNVFVRWIEKNRKFVLNKYLVYPKRTYSFDDGLEGSFSDFKKDAMAEECETRLLSNTEENFKCLAGAVRSEKFKDLISDKCDQVTKKVSKQKIVDTIYRFGKDRLQESDLLSCMKGVSEKIDSSKNAFSDEDKNCEIFRGAFGNLKNLINLDVSSGVTFKISCDIANDLPVGKCISGNFKEGEGNSADAISLRFSSTCKDFSENELEQVIYHEVLHRVIPSSIVSVVEKEQLELAVGRFTSFCKSQDRDLKKLCSYNKNESKFITTSQLQSTQQKITQQEVPVDLAQETPVNKVVIPNAFPSVNQYLGPPAVVAAAAPTGFPAVQSAQARVTPVLNFARSMMGSVERAYASGKFDPNKTYSYDSSDSMASKLDSSSGSRRSPANEASVPLKTQGAEGSVFNPAGSAKPNIPEGSSARSPAQIAGEKARALVKASSRLSTDQKVSAEKVLGYVLSAKNKYELKIFLTHKKGELSGLGICARDASTDEVFGYADCSAAKMIFSISSDGKLIDETLEP